MICALLSAVPTVPAAPSVPAGQQVRYNLPVTDPDKRLGTLNRTFDLALPYKTLAHRQNLTELLSAPPVDAAPPAAGYPLLLYFHGQYGSPAGAAGFSSLGAKEGFITVAAQGLAENSLLALDTTWSVAAEGRTDVCDRTKAQFVMTSCRTTNRVSVCNWATCYSDVALTSTLLVALTDAGVPYDADRVYLSGCSNGGMLSDYLVTQLPGVFAGVVPWYGAFLKDFLPPSAAAALAGSSALLLIGEDDTIIPPAGGESPGGYEGGYLYVSQLEQLSAWASANGCDARTTPLALPAYDTLAKTCVEHRGCDGGVRVGYCRYKGQAHGFQWQQAADSWMLWLARRFGA